MISHPHMLQAASFIKDNSDLISAAKAEPLSREEIERARSQKDPSIQVMKARSMLSEIRRVAMQGMQSWPNHWVKEFGSDTKIGTPLRIRLPTDYVKPDGPMPMFWVSESNFWSLPEDGSKPIKLNR